MAVISEVPTEVLTEFFYLLCKKPIFVRELNNLSCKEDFPWAVGLVSRQWRTAFLSYPPIWASLTLSENYHDPPSSESYAKEINRRLALYLERSGGHPLRLNISLWSDYNKAFTKMALKMLSACSYRWQAAKFDLFCDAWRLDSILPRKGKLPTLEWLEIRCAVDRKRTRGIFEVAPRLTHAYIGPWAKISGWILPWTQLTELTLTINDDSVIENGDVPNLLPMLHNIKEFRLRNYGEMDFEGSFPQFTPTPLNQLRVLEVPHPAILSWFEAPSLCEICFTDYQDYDEPLDVHGQISSLIQRSSCRIRKLSFDSDSTFYVGTLNDVEELVIDYRRSPESCPSIDISSGSLPKLRLLTIICSIHEDFEPLVNFLTTALKSARVPTRSECSSGTPISLLERVTVELHYDREQPKIPKRLLKVADKWPVVVFRTQRS
ncbi:hypothetical protein JOM56_012087 [Amanita muscaria]